MLDLDSVAVVRACRGVTTMPEFTRYVNLEVIAWLRGEGGDSFVGYTPYAKDLNNPSPAQSLASELEEVVIGRKHWGEVCFVQFLCIKSCDVPLVVQAAHGIPLIAGPGAHAPLGKAKGPVEDDAPTATHGTTLDIALWRPTKQIAYTKAPHRQVHERPCEGVIISVKPNENAIAVIEGRSTRVHKFGSSGGIRGTPPRCHERIVARGDVEGDSEADDRQERKGAQKVRNLIKNVANSPPNKNLPLTQLVPESIGGRSKEEDAELDRSLWVNWDGRSVPGHQISCEDEVLNAQADEGDEIDVDEDVRSCRAPRGSVTAALQEEPNWDYLVAPTDGKLPRDVTREEVADNWKDVFAAKVKEIAGLYDLGCFKQ